MTCNGKKDPQNSNKIGAQNAAQQKNSHHPLLCSADHLLPAGLPDMEKNWPEILQTSAFFSFETKEDSGD